MESLVVERDCIEMLQVICWENSDFALRKNTLFSFKKLLMKMPASKLAALANRICLHNYKSSLVMALLLCGDHEFQEYLIEILTRLAKPLKDWKNVLKSWFSDFPPTVDAIDVLDSKAFDVTSRTFLNRVNASCPLGSRIHSLPCLYAAISGRIELEKPSGYDELWFDCSPRTGDIQLLINGGDGSWARVTLQPAFIRSIKCSHRQWRLPRGDVESSQLLIKVHPEVVVPLENPVSVSELGVVLKKDEAFQKLENDFLKWIYAHCYEPERAKLVATRGRRSINRSSSTTSIITRSSNSTKLSFLNVSLSTIERDPSLIALGVQNSSSVSHDAIPNVKQIASSTPVKFKKAGKTVRKVDNVGTDDVQVRKEDDSSIKSKHRSSISDQITFVSRRGASENSHREDESTHLNESPPNEPNLPEASAVNLNFLGDMFTNETVLTLQNNEQALTADSRTVAQSQSPVHIDKLCDTLANKLVDDIGAEERHFQDNTPSNPKKSIPETPASEYVFGSQHTTLVDFKELQPPQPVISEPSPSPHTFSEKFFGRFRKAFDNMSESEMSMSSSSKISNRQFRGVVQIRNPSLDLSKCVDGSTANKTPQKPVDPFSYTEDNDEIESYERVAEDLKGKFRTPASVRKKRKLYTPGKDDALHSDGRESPSHGSDRQNHKLSSKSNRQNRKKVKCLLDRSYDGIRGKKNCPSKSTGEKQVAEKILRRSSRTRKKMTYKETLSSHESGVSIIEPRVSSKRSRIPYSRKTELLRSEGVTLSPPTPSGSVPRKIYVDLDALSPPGSLTAYEPEPGLSSPPPQPVEMVQISPPPKCKAARVRKKKGKSVVIQGGKGPDNGPETEDHIQTIPGHDENHALCTPSSTSQPKPLNEEKVVSVEASSPSLVQLGDSHLSGWIDALSDLILNQVKTYVIGVKSDNSSFVESIGVNLSTCLETLKTTMNTIREESLNIARSTANVQMACEKGVAHFDVVHEMMKVIEVHHGSAVAACVRNNDPRTYSQLRQQIHKLIGDNIGKKPSDL